MKLLRIALLLFLMLASWPVLAQPVPEAKTGLEWVITVAPIHGGSARLGVANSRPLVDTEFVIQNDKGPLTCFTTDAEGQFRVPLAPGHYTVSAKGRRGGIGRYSPFEVDVVAGEMTKVQWPRDTGMR